MKDRREHLKWCRNRALFLLDDGKPLDALAGMHAALPDHPETKEILIGREFRGTTHDVGAIRDWINSFG